MDFADDVGRAVVITGIPFPPRDDPKVHVLYYYYYNDVTPGVHNVDSVNANLIMHSSVKPYHIRTPLLGGACFSIPINIAQTTEFDWRLSPY